MLAGRALWVRRFAGALLIGAGLAAGSVTGSAPAAAASVDAVKAGFIFNFARFTRWPDSKRSGRAFTFCFQRGSITPRVYSGWSAKSIRGAKVRTRQVDREETGIDACHVLIVAGNGAPSDGLVRAARTHKTLLIASGAAFVRGGGHIALVERGGKMRFMINRPALRAAGLDVSSRLLRLAHNVIKAADG